MRKIILLLLFPAVLLLISACEKSPFDCSKCQYFDFDSYICKEAACCRDHDCAEGQKCINPKTQYSACIGEKDCSEELKDKQCGKDKPSYCSSGKTINLCSFCGCNLGFQCINQSCVKIRYPIILVHGFASGGGSWSTFKKWFEADGFTVFAPDFVPPEGDINLLTAELDNEINNVLNKTKSPYVDIVAHSMGGIIVRNYLNKVNDTPITKIVFIGTPHKGSSLSWYANIDSIAAQQMRYGSVFMIELNKHPLKANISYLNIIGTAFENLGIQHDGMILASEAYLDNVTNFYFKVDHFGLQKDRGIYDDVKKFLTT